MLSAALPLTRDLVLIGGGHTHALILRRWGMNPLAGARLTVINPGPTAPYTGMLPGYVAGHYDRADLDIDLVRLARFAGARLILGHATGLDLNARRIAIEGRPPVEYDVASVDIGITSAMPDLPGFAAHGVPAKPLGAFADRWTRFLERAGPARVSVIGGGVAGIELAMAMGHALSRANRSPEITVIEAGRALRGMSGRAEATLRGALSARNIALLENTEPTAVTSTHVILGDARHVASDFVVGAAGARPWDWPGETGLDLKDGFITVDATLRSSDPHVFAAGDCAYLSHAPRPKAGVFAVRAARVLAHNLRAALAGGPSRRFNPQRDYIKLVSLGETSALFEKWGLAFQGPGLWRLKDRIDRRFMSGLRDLPRMPVPPLPKETAYGVREAYLGGKPICAGCGGKVGGGVLMGALSRLPDAGRNDILSGPGDDAALLRVGGAHQVLTTDHLRAFTEDPYVFARIAAEHALGDIWAMGAEPQAVLASVMLPRMSDALQARTLDDVMRGASDVFVPVGASIVGGHTTTATDLTLGFTLTGLVPDRPVTLSGARAGDALILTRPIGTGTLLAGEMALETPGDAMAGLLRELMRSQASAARILRKAHAMTDVTGFGLFGHLRNMATASGTGARLWLDAVPLYDGAAALAGRGVRSSLYPSNRTIAAGVTLPARPEADLLFDPQTAGGLLAAVGTESAAALLDDLTDAGHTAAMIGEITDRPGEIEVN